MSALKIIIAISAALSVIHSSGMLKVFRSYLTVQKENPDKLDEDHKTRFQFYYAAQWYQMLIVTALACIILLKL